MRLVGISRRQLLYVPVLIGATALLFAKNIAYAGLLPVDGFGALNQAFLISGMFASFAGAGLQLLGQKVLPQYYGAGDTESAESLLGSAVGVFGVVVAAAAVVLGIAGLSGLSHSVGFWYATLLCAASQYMFMLRLLDFKSELRFLQHGLLSSLRAVLLLGAGAAAAAYWHDVVAVLIVEGVVTMALAAELLRGSRGRSVARRALGLASERYWLAQNLPAALRLLWLNGTLTLLYALDRWAGIAFLSKREYGIYALGLIVVLVLETLQAIVNVSAFPLMGRLIAAGHHRRAFRFATTATAVVVLATVVVYAPFVVFVDDALRAWLPAYTEASSVIKVLAIAGALRLADFYATFAILCDQESRLAKRYGVLIGLVVGAVVAIRVVAEWRMGPGQIALVAVVISLCALLLNLDTAWRALRLRAGAISA